MDRAFHYCLKLFRLFIIGACLVTSPQSIAESSVTYFYNDHLRSPVAAADENDKILWRQHYQPFGKALDQKDKQNTVGYTGHKDDKETGLTYMQARYYDSEIGRFMGLDPAGFNERNSHSFNFYNYANNNPYGFVDPDGLAPEWIFRSKTSGWSLNRLDAGFGPGLNANGGLATGRASDFRSVKQIRNEQTQIYKSSIAKRGKAVISPQKQAGHIPGTPHNANRISQNKPTSSFFGGKSGERLTQQAFEKGKPVPGRPNVREHDFGISTGTGPNGGMQSRVRVHQDSKDRIHGHPSGPEKF